MSVPSINPNSVSVVYCILFEYKKTCVLNTCVSKTQTHHCFRGITCWFWGVFLLLFLCALVAIRKMKKRLLILGLNRYH